LEKQDDIMTKFMDNLKKKATEDTFQNEN